MNILFKWILEFSWNFDQTGHGTYAFFLKSNINPTLCGFTQCRCQCIAFDAFSAWTWYNCVIRFKPYGFCFIQEYSCSAPLAHKHIHQHTHKNTHTHTHTHTYVVYSNMIYFIYIDSSAINHITTYFKRNAIYFSEFWK